nr:hypothetical protein [Succinivibrionaceae bacterium]
GEAKKLPPFVTPGSMAGKLKEDIYPVAQKGLPVYCGAPDFISAMAANECDVEHCAAPDEYRIEEYAAALAGRICRGEYDRWEQCGEEILDRIAAYIEECQKDDFPDTPQGSEEDVSL